MFRKFLTNTKNKIKTPHIKIKSDRSESNALSTQQPLQQSEELEKKKETWQSELEEMSEFLVMKSAAEQEEEGSKKPVDTAEVEEWQGLPVLAFRFDISGFPEDVVNICVENNTLYIDAQHEVDKGERVYKKTLLRKMELPEHVDPRNTWCTKDKNGILTIQMPLHLAPKRRPDGPNVFPIVEDSSGRRHLRIVLFIGAEFTSDDVSVVTNGKRLRVKAGYNADVGKYCQQVNTRELSREYQLPENIEIDDVTTVLTPDGRLFVDVLLVDEPPFRCHTTREEELR